jgi:hypothetical protein
MTALPGTAPKGPTKHTAASLPFTPTADANGEPTVCHICGMRSDLCGLGSERLRQRGRDDPRYICVECVLIVERIRSARRLDQFELRALDGGVDAVGEYLETIGIYDLTLMDELNRRMIVKAAWQGSADALRRALSEGVAPF